MGTAICEEEQKTCYLGWGQGGYDIIESLELLLACGRGGMVIVHMDQVPH